jgi:Tol biopolymer transport system component
MKRRESLGVLVLGVSIAFLETSLAEMRYVYLSDGHVPTVTNLESAATNIQATIDEATNSETVLYFSTQETAGGDYDLYTMRPDPANPNLQSLPMNDSSGDQCHPVVSPNGRFVLYSGRITTSPAYQLLVLDRWTGESRFLLDGHPEDWHPSDQRFVYISNESCSEAIHEAFVSVTATGLVVTSTRVLFDSSKPAGSAGVQYSPDGRRIAFTYCPDYCSYENLEIYVASLEESLPVSGTNLLRLTANGACEVEPHWTPDGQQIIWGRSNGQNLELWRRNADGSGSEQRLGTWTNAENAYLPFCIPPSGYKGPSIAAFYHKTLKKIILLRQDGGQDTLDIGPNDSVEGLDWVVTTHPSIHYVSLYGAHVAPFTNWCTAATNIQAAINVSSIDDTVLVTNGLYDSGGIAMYGSLTSRIAITKAINVRSVNGPRVTMIRGSKAPEEIDGYGDGAVRCVYLAKGAVLAGFTLTNGYTRANGDLDQEQSGGGVWCEGPSAVLSNCVLTGNGAFNNGGGLYDGTLYNCTVAGNEAESGGGAAGGVLYNCTLTGNEAGSGGGVNDGVLYNCVLTSNRATRGGGTSGGILFNCTLAFNSATRGGGTSGGILYNCIVYYNNASIGSNSFYGTLSYTCTAPNPGGQGNITSEPQFVDATAGDYRLLPSSPCMDTGINQDWMNGAKDLAGNLRVLNSTVDMGAYEFAAFLGNIRIWLQGPYDTNTDEMTTALNAADSIPLTSPYADNPRQVTTIPSNATDWVLLQLQSSTNSIPFISKSVFLGNKGYLLSDGGTTGIMLEASTGSYYVVVKHRNHLAVMSANPVPFTNSPVSYDFTTNVNRYYGGTNGAVQLESNAWGMIAGDADGDGEILQVDALLYDTQANSTGYERADFNLDGIVSNDDLSVFWSNNMGRCTAVVQGETILKPVLKIYPNRRTLLAGSNYIFSASGGTGTISWAFVKNPSGGEILATYSTSIVYQAGTTSSCVDVLEAWDQENRLGRAYVNVIGQGEMAKAGKAIIVAGRKSASDPLWPITDYLAGLAFNTLLYRGYDKANIQYLSPEPDRDVDGNGQADDDIDLKTTLANVALTFTNWATRTDRLFVYLVDHGGYSLEGGSFYLNDSEKLMATNLGAWLDDLQNAYTTTVTVLIDCCYAGSFLDELAYTGAAQRIVIAACGTNEPTYFLAGGLVSFSDAFFGGIMRGDNVEQAWLAASNAMFGYQNACWYDKENGAASLYLGASLVAGKDIPQIGSVVGNQLLTRTTAATLWAGDVVSVYPIERVWCLVAPPGHRPNPENPVADLPCLDLIYDSGSGRYQSRFEGFSEEGSYKILFYAEDVWGSISPPRQSEVRQSGYDERLILVGSGPTNLANWARINNLARDAYRTFQARWLGNESIYYLSALTNQDVNGDGANDVDAFVSAANLANAITNGAGSIDALTVYLLGEGTNQTLRLNESEYLDANSLNGWLNAFLKLNQQAKVSVIMDFSESGRFLPGLAAANRICMSSCRSNQPAIWTGEGLVSFSRYFLSGIFYGYNLYEAFSCAERAIRRVTGPIGQRAQLDDNGDGVSNKRDGSLARQSYIGSAFMTGSDTPTIGNVTPDTVLTDTNALWLWALGVKDMDGISNVWCVITPPDYNGVGELTKINLIWNDDRERYESLYTAFCLPGTYVLTFQAVDHNGAISTPMQVDVVLPDAYESDNTPLEAKAFEVSDVQTHNFHCSNDEDWVKFYAISNYFYEIETIQLGSNVDTVLDVYYENADGTLTNIIDAEDRDSTGVGMNQIEATSLDNPVPGMYYVRVSSGTSNAWGVSSDYNLTIDVPAGGGNLVVIAVDKLHTNQAPPGAVVIVDGMRTQAFAGSVTLTLPDLSSGIHTIAVPVVAGYLPEEDPAQPNQVTNQNSYLYGNPKAARVEDDRWRFAVFQFYPYVKVSTGTVIRDRWTREWLSNAVITFKATSGILSNVVYDGYPNDTNCTYKSHWYSRADGTFPSNVRLPAVNYDLTLKKTDYSNGVISTVIVNPTPGQVIDLGTLWLSPVDTNANGIADWWEERYFGANRPPAEEDSDGDGHNNREEYLLGTDPTNRDSVMKLHIAAQNTHGVTLTWPVANGRTYDIRTSRQLSSELWTQQVFGPLEATNCQTQMQWTDTNAIDQTYRVYRLVAPVP